MEQKTDPVLAVAQRLNQSVGSVIGATQLEGFERAYKIASAAQELSATLTTEYMKPIMALQNNRLGFKTDKTEGYPEPVVKNCLIEAVLTGVQPFGNQFNIIAGNCYITKEGFGYLLANYPGLSYKIIPSLPRIKDESAAVLMKIEWTLGGIKNTEEIEFPIKINKFMGADAVIGKATRKARAWLYNTINGTEIGDGDVDDVKAERVEVVGSSPLKTIVHLEDLEMLYDLKKEFLSEEDKAFADRIISTKEVASYQKLYAHLQSK